MRFSKINCFFVFDCVGYDTGPDTGCDTGYIVDVYGRRYLYCLYEKIII